MKKFKAVVTIFAAAMLLVCGVGCAGNNDDESNPPLADGEWQGNWTRPDVPDEPVVNVHSCEHSCYVCGKCLLDCEEEACAEKCFEEHGRTKYVFNGTDERVIKKGGVNVNAAGYLGNINANASAEISYYISVEEKTTVCFGATISEMHSDSFVTAKTPIAINGELYFSRGYLKAGSTVWENFYTVWLGCLELDAGVTEITLRGKGDAYNFKDFTFLSAAELTLVTQDDSHKCSHKNQAGKCTDYTCNENSCLDKDETGWSAIEINPGDERVLKYATRGGEEVSLWNANEGCIGNLANGPMLGFSNQTVAFSFEASEETWVRISLSTGAMISPNTPFVDMYSMTLNGKEISTGATVKSIENPTWATYLINNIVYLKVQKGVNNFVMVHKPNNTGDNINNILLGYEKGSITFVQAVKPGTIVAAEGVTLAAAGNKTTVNEGATLQLTANVTPSNASNKKVTYTSGDETKATVDGNGLVTGVAAGEVTITATTEDGNHTAQLILTVTVPVTGVTLNAAGGATEVAETQTLQLTAMVAPENAYNKKVTFSTSDPLKATVDGNGLVTAISAGEVTITATTEDGAKTAQITLTVTANEQKVPVSGVTLTAAGGKTSLKKGETLQLTATVAPDNATIKGVKFSSGDETKATVDENGLVTALNGGEVAITVTTDDGAKSDTITLTVSVDAESVNVNSDKSVILAGETLNLTATVLPADATDKTVTWKVTKDNVVVEDALTVTDGIAAFTPEESGVYKIIATTADGTEISGEFTVNVHSPITGTDHFFEGEEAAMTAGSIGSIQIHRNDGDTVNARNNTSLGNINANIGATLTYKVIADEECEAGLYLSLAFGGEKYSNIFSITLNGKPVEIIPEEFVQPGANWITYTEFWFANVKLEGGLNTIVLTVTGYCGNYDYMTLKSATGITAANVVSDIEISVSKELLKPAETTKLGITVTGGTAEDVTVTSSNPEVATVDAEGNVTAVAEGKTTVTVKANDEGGVTKTVNIFVKSGDGTAYEAEAAQLTNTTVEADGKHVGGLNNAGAKVTFTVSSENGGKALLRIHTSVVVGDKLTIDRYYKVSVNGVEIDLSGGQFAFNGLTPNWNVDNGFFTVEIDLEAGADNTIEIISVDTDVQTNLDKIVIYE